MLFRLGRLVVRLGRAGIEEGRRKERIKKI